MTGTMKAFEFAGVQSGLQLKEVPRPTAEENQVIIQVKAAGLCHSDCFILNDETCSFITHTPITLGHEVAGTVVEVGPNVSNVKIGDRVVVGLPSHPVADQDWSKAPGLGYNGGYAEFAMVWADQATPIPPQVSFAQAAVATDSISTAYHAVVTEGGVTKGSTVGIMGLGGLGMVGLQIAALYGAQVYGVDIVEDKLSTARRLGACQCAKSLDEFSGVEFDTIVDFAGAGQHTTAPALKAVRKGGKVVVVGLASKTVSVDTHDLITRNVSLQGSIGAGLDELDSVLRLIAEGRITPQLEEIPFASIPQGLDKLDRGEVSGRLFADPSKASE